MIPAASCFLGFRTFLSHVGYILKSNPKYFQITSGIMQKSNFFLTAWCFSGIKRYEGVGAQTNVSMHLEGAIKMHGNNFGSIFLLVFSHSNYLY